MSGENRPLVTDEPVEVQDFSKITDHVTEIYRMYLKLVKKNRKMTIVTGWTWKHSDLDRLCPKTSLDTDSLQWWG